MPKPPADQNKAEVIRQYLAKRPNATAMEAVRGVKRVDVSVALPAKVRPGSAAPAPSDGTKAEQIRQAAKSLGRKVRPRDVIAKLAEKRVSVSSAQVSAVLASMGMRRRRRGGRRRVVETVASTLTLDSLLAAKKLVSQLGSVEAAKTAVDALAKLIRVVAAIGAKSTRVGDPCTFLQQAWPHRGSP